MARPQCDTPLDGLGFSWCLLMLFHCFLWVHPWASKEEENKREKGKTKHTQKLQQVGTNSTSSMVSSVHSEMTGWGFFLSFFNFFLSDSTLIVHKRQETKHSQQQLSFFFPVFFWLLLCFVRKQTWTPEKPLKPPPLLFGLLVADR